MDKTGDLRLARSTCYFAFTAARMTFFFFLYTNGVLLSLLDLTSECYYIIGLSFLTQWLKLVKMKSIYFKFCKVATANIEFRDNAY